MHAQRTGVWPVTPDERPHLQRVARALEDALDGLPPRSPWRPTLDQLHERIAIGLDPAEWR